MCVSSAYLKRNGAAHGDPNGHYTAFFPERSNIPRSLPQLGRGRFLAGTALRVAVQHRYGPTRTHTNRYLAWYPGCTSEP